MHPFHLAFPVHDLHAARRFYGGILGCPEGRSSDHWVDFDFFGHQIVAHLAPDLCMLSDRTSPEPQLGQTNLVDGKQIPVRHFGFVLDMESWRGIAAKLKGQVEFIVEPHIRFEGEPGEQATMFFLDPSGNALEVKAMADRANLFAT